MPDILIVKTSSFGDILHGLQVAQSLKAQWPASRISWAVRGVFRPLVEAAELVTTVYAQQGSGFGPFRALLAAVKQQPFAVVIDMQGLARSAAITLAARAPLKIGRSDAREGAWLCYDRKAPLPPQGCQSHAIEVLLELLPLLGLQAELRGPVQFRPQPLTATTALAEAAILLFPESRRTEKEWPGFAALAGELSLAYPDRRILILGNRPDACFAGLSERISDLRGYTPLNELIELVRRSALVVANDSGPMHLAAALGRPVLALFGPTDPRRFGPYPLAAPGRQVLVAPRGELARLDVERVLAAVTALLTEEQP